MATYAFVVIGIDIAPRGGLIFVDPKYRILGAEDHAVVALET